MIAIAAYPSAIQAKILSSAFGCTKIYSVSESHVAILKIIQNLNELKFHKKYPKLAQTYFF